MRLSFLPMNLRGESSMTKVTRRTMRGDDDDVEDEDKEDKDKDEGER